MTQKPTIKKIGENAYLKIMQTNQNTQRKIRFYITRDNKVMSTCVLQVNGKAAWFDVTTVNKELSGIRKVREMNQLFGFVEEYLRQERLVGHGETNQKFAKFLSKRKGYQLRQIPYLPGGKPKIKLHYNPKRM